MITLTSSEPLLPIKSIQCSIGTVKEKVSKVNVNIWNGDIPCEINQAKTITLSDFVKIWCIGGF